MQDDGTGGIDDFDVVTTGYLVGFGGLAVCTQQHLDVVQLSQLIVIDGDEALCVKAFHLDGIMHNVTQTIQGGTGCQFLLCFLDGGSDTEAETAAFVYLNVHFISMFIVTFGRCGSLVIIRMLGG